MASFALLMVWFLGENQIIEMNEYMGMTKFRASYGLFFSFIYIFALLVIFLNSNQATPHGILIGILFFYALIWFFAFYSVSGYVDSYLVFAGGLIFFIPMLIFFLSEKLPSRL